MTVQRLAERPDLYRHGIKQAVIATLADATQDAALDAASTWALGLIGGRYKRPLVSWEDDLAAAVCQKAAYELLCMVGYNPAAGADVNVRNRRDDAERWLTSVARQEITPNIVGAATQSPTYDAPSVTSLPRQGWERGTIR